MVFPPRLLLDFWSRYIKEILYALIVSSTDSQVRPVHTHPLYSSVPWNINVTSTRLHIRLFNSLSRYFIFFLNLSLFIAYSYIMTCFKISYMGYWIRNEKLVSLYKAVKRILSLILAESLSLVNGKNVSGREKSRPILRYQFGNRQTELRNTTKSRFPSWDSKSGGHGCWGAFSAWPLVTVQLLGVPGIFRYMLL